MGRRNIRNRGDHGGSPSGSWSIKGAGCTTLVEVGLPEGAAAVELALGYEHSCARTEDGKVWCWGLGDFGQVGDGVATFGDRPTPSAVSGLPAAVVQLSAGSSNTCALDASGQAWCWGQLRTLPIIGKVVGSLEPVEVDLESCPIGKPAAY